MKTEQALEHVVDHYYGKPVRARTHDSWNLPQLWTRKRDLIMVFMVTSGELRFLNLFSRFLSGIGASQSRSCPKTTCWVNRW